MFFSPDSFLWSGWPSAQRGPHPEDRGHGPVRDGKRAGGPGAAAVWEPRQAGHHPGQHGRRLHHSAPSRPGDCRRATGQELEYYIFNSILAYLLHPILYITFNLTYYPTLPTLVCLKENM